jgi:multidrug efflux pump subunit AcrA (membrane-fusion protein)
MNKKVKRKPRHDFSISESGVLKIFLILFIFLNSCKSANPDDYTVKSGFFRQSVIEPGELDAINASYIMMPRIAYQYGYQFKIVGMADHGKIVQKGDSVIKLDPSSVYKYILDREDVLDNELASAKKQEVQSQNNLQDLNAQLKNEQSAYDLKKLQVETSKFDTETQKKIWALEFQQAMVSLNKAKRNLALRSVLDNYDREIQNIKVIQRREELVSAKETLKQFLIKAPLDGTFQVASNRNYSNPQNWKIGDSPYTGYIIASIPDISRMKAKTYINEAEFRKVKPGMKAIVRLDALPSVPFNGTVKDISKICFARDRQKVFNVIIEIDGSDQRLRPGMTVNCEYILFESDKDLFLPNNCLLKEKGHSYVFLRRGRNTIKTEVQTGAANSNYTVIKSGVKQGQKLVPFDKILNPNNI